MTQPLRLKEGTAPLIATVFYLQPEHSTGSLGRRECVQMVIGKVMTGTSQWLSGKESACNAGAKGDVGSVAGSGRSPGERNGNPLQYSCLENSMGRGAWWATVHGVGHD